MKIPEPTNEQIAERAYQIYLANGRREGHAQDDWLQAQYELLRQPIRELIKLSEKPPMVRNSLNTALLIGAVHAALMVATS